MTTSPPQGQECSAQISTPSLELMATRTASLLSPESRAEDGHDVKPVTAAAAEMALNLAKL